ncbi:PPR repeat [Musa troglodytarum]|nr:PPR repeat [Musa troglodytarum]
MYAKCGHIELALRFFDSMTNRNVVSWNALITGFSQHGYERAALELFGQMQKEGIQPDDYTFSGVLVSCSRLGLVEQGCQYFRVMSAEYGLKPKSEHYACMVDLFGRAGKLYEAMEFINIMPFEPDQLIWEALLASCKIHGNIELVKFVAKKIMQMRPEDPSPYITLSTMYASMSMWDRKASVQAIMKDGGMQKEPGRSWIEGQDLPEDTIYTLRVGGA